MVSNFMSAGWSLFGCAKKLLLIVVHQISVDGDVRVSDHAND
jgi:hypothetical protein